MLLAVNKRFIFFFLSFTCMYWYYKVTKRVCISLEREISLTEHFRGEGRIRSFETKLWKRFNPEWSAALRTIKLEGSPGKYARALTYIHTHTGNDYRPARVHRLYYKLVGSYKWQFSYYRAYYHSSHWRLTGRWNDVSFRISAKKIMRSIVGD